MNSTDVGEGLSR